MTSTSPAAPLDDAARDLAGRRRVFAQPQRVERSDPRFAEMTRRLKLD